MPRVRTLKPVRPNQLLEAAYRQKLDRLIERMHRSLVHWLSAGYRRAEPEVAQLMAADDSPARELRALMRRLARQWQRNFNEAASELASYFAQEAADRSDVALRSILRRAGISVRFQTTRAVNDVLQATVAQNVSLIRSIAAEHLTQVEGMVMRSVQEGRDLAPLVADLQHQFGVTRRRAALIARHQNNMATAAIQRVRQTELGIQEAIWMHSGGGRYPRPAHVKAGRDQVRYKVAEGWWDPHERKRVWPGTLINCRCVSRPVLPGFAT